jgi:flavodoxin
MKVLVAYMSQTGNTRKIAEAIYGEIPDNKEIKRIEEVESLNGYDMTFLGFPVHGEKPEKKVADLLAKHCVQGKSVALFVTHGSQEGDAPALQHWLSEFKLAASGANIVGMFDCQGQLARAIKFIMSIHPNARYRAWAKMDTSQGQPDQARVEKARVFAKQVMRNFHANMDADKVESGSLVTAGARA